MFTGLIEKTGLVKENFSTSCGRRLILQAEFPDLTLGESIAVNGVCLTFLKTETGELAFDLSRETLEKTQLAGLQAGCLVNLERAMRAHDRFGGHYVSGHIDTTAVLSEIIYCGDSLKINVSDFATKAANLYLIPKGSITLDGVSLTINEVNDTQISLMLIPHTLAATTFHTLNCGHRFNVEFDYLARIVVHQLNLAGALHREEMLREKSS